jgi:hypothetical protein
MPCAHACAVGLRAEPLCGGREGDAQRAGAAVQAGGPTVSAAVPSVHTCIVGYWAAVGDVVVVKETLSELELPYKQVGHVKLGTRHWWFEIGPLLCLAPFARNTCS